MVDGKAKRSPFTGAFYSANVMEIFERLAWYGFFAVAAVYLTDPKSKGGLGFTDSQQGMLMGVGTFILYLLPVITGGLADRYGFKKMFATAYVILVPAYFLLGQMRTFGSFFAVFLVVALGAAIFKPLVVGTVARETDETNSTLGFGIFYLMVNIGGAVGPVVSGVMREWGYFWVFLLSSIWISCNFLVLFVFFKERKVATDGGQTRSLKKVLSDTVTVIGNFRVFLLLFGIILALLATGNEWLTWTQTGIVVMSWLLVNVLYDIVMRDRLASGKLGWLLDRMRLGDWRMGLFLLIVSGFWTSFNQIWFTMPKYIRDYVDTRPAVDLIERGFNGVGLDSTGAWVIARLTEDGQIKPEMIVNIDAAAIIIFQLLVSWAVQKLNAFATMILGVLIGAVGIGACALGGAEPGVSIWLCALGIFVFAFGEMSAAPTSQSYIGRIAPEGREGLYMGYYFLAMALGNLFGGVLSGPVYGTFTKTLGRPDLFWAVSGAVGVVTALGFLAFNTFVVKKQK